MSSICRDRTTEVPSALMGNGLVAMVQQVKMEAHPQEGGSPGSVSGIPVIMMLTPAHRPADVFGTMSP